MDIIFYVLLAIRRGKKTDIELLKEAAKRCEQKKIRFVLDECFLEFEKEPESLFDKINIVHYPHCFCFGLLRRHMRSRGSG